MEVVIPAAPNMDLDFNNSRSYLSAPSTPKRFGEYFFSAPTSPATHLSQFYRDLDEFSMMNDRYENREDGPSSTVPFNWEETPGTPKSFKGSANKHEDEFAFDFSADLEKASLTAEELFDGGKIRPLKPPPRLQLGGRADGFTAPNSPLLSPRSPRSPVSQGKKIIMDVFSPRRKKGSDPFAMAVENTRKKTEQERGRGRTPALSSSNSGRRAARSVSPLRVSEHLWEEQEKIQQSTKQSSLNSKASFSSTTTTTSSKGSKKWSLKDFLLFRSASEGRATDKDPFSKYTALYKKHDDIKNSSFRSTEGSLSKRKGRVSAHELHYTANKAASEDLKKKTFLPYKQGILGRLAFNPAVNALANGFGSFARS